MGICVVKLFIGRGANINVVWSNDTTPLFVAAHYQHWDIFEFLLSQTNLDLTIPANTSELLIAVARKAERHDDAKKIIELFEKCRAPSAHLPSDSPRL